MGNCCGTQQDPPKKSLGDLLYDCARLNAERDYVEQQIRENPDRRPQELLELNNRKRDDSLWESIVSVDQQVLDLLSQISHLVFEPPQFVLSLPTGPTIGIQWMLDEVWSHLVNQQDVSLIGLYGMGGVGKTTLLKTIYNELLRSSTLNFDIQLWIFVSKTPKNLVKIQNQIGEKIGLCGSDWGTNSPEEKSNAIYKVLVNKKYILLLDDIWAHLDLGEIGIPYPNFENKSIIIFTTRSKEVCVQMKARQVHVQCLNEEESWNLFRENVGESALCGHPDIPRLARDVMKECCGLPLALITLGLAMAGKESVHDWLYAIQELKCYTEEFSTMTEQVFPPLKYSYDNLRNDAIRSCFLYCSLYAQDGEISKSDLVDKWICEGFLGRFCDLDQDQNEGYSYINTLINASLLEKCSLEQNVRMHGLIRNMALWIAGDVFYVEARAGLTDVPKNVKWKHVEKLSLMDNSIREFNNRPNEVTNLKTILVSQAGFYSINNDFWKFVPNLKVLDLSGNPFLTSLPEEFCELVCLQYLNLAWTGLSELPNEFRKLVKLKYLNLQYTRITTISEGSLSGMKELSVFRSSCYIDRTGYTFLGHVNFVKEFEGLSYLRDVAISAASKVEITNLTSSVKVLSFTTELTLTSFTSSNSSLDISFLKQMKSLRSLQIHDLKAMEVVVAEEQGSEISTINNKDGFNNTLRQLEISWCRRLKNLSWLVFFPNLESIDVSYCDEMETLVSENEYRLDNQVEPFAKLQTLQLGVLRKLGSIYFTSLSFPCLINLNVICCDNLNKLPFNYSSCHRGGGIEIIRGSNQWWNGLDWEDEATRTNFDSCFTAV